MNIAIWNLPQFLQEMLDNCPAAGTGVNQWLYNVARHLHAHMDEQAMFALLKEKSSRCGRSVKDLEIARQIKCSRAAAWIPNRPELFEHAEGLKTEIQVTPAAPDWPEPNLDDIRRIVAQPYRLQYLRDTSPVKLTDDLPNQTEEIIDAIFPGNPLLCCGVEMYQFATRRREVWRGRLAKLPLIVPNPMLRVKGLTQDNKTSEHTLDATAARVYQVVEFDFSEFAPDGKTETIWTPLVREWKAAGITIADACAALHLHLSVARDLVLVTHSGGKSLHGWYASWELTEEQNKKFFSYAVSLGADKATWLRSQFVRMPDGTRQNGKRQAACYFDPGKAVKG